MTQAKPPKLYLLDVEGTVAPISLVYEQLFPYARAHFRDVSAEDIAAEPGRARATLTCSLKKTRRRRMRDLVAKQFTATRSSWDRSDSSYLYYWLMDRDRKSTALKSLQGKIWKAGFESWRTEGNAVCRCAGGLRALVGRRRRSPSTHRVRSRRSCCCFAIPSFGDLTPLIAGYFDTRTGPKTASASYRADRLGNGCASRAKFCSFPMWCANWMPRAKPAARRGWWCGKGMRRSRMRMGTPR